MARPHEISQAKDPHSLLPHTVLTIAVSPKITITGERIKDEH